MAGHESPQLDSRERDRSDRDCTEPTQLANKKNRPFFRNLTCHSLNPRPVFGHQPADRLGL